MFLLQVTMDMNVGLLLRGADFKDIQNPSLNIS
jgi:hypothetical protein